jgi:multidrug resistance protein
MSSALLSFRYMCLGVSIIEYFKWGPANADSNTVACGPLILSPLSEIYGRLYIYWGSNVAFVCFSIGCAFTPSFDGLIVFRFLAGCAGATAQTVGGGTIADLFIQVERGLPMSLYTLGPVIGPAIGPVGGGFLAQAMGWRWVFYLLIMLGGVAMVIPTLSDAPAFANQTRS